MKQSERVLLNSYVVLTRNLRTSGSTNGFLKMRLLFNSLLGWVTDAIDPHLPPVNARARKESKKGGGGSLEFGQRKTSDTLCCFFDNAGFSASIGTWKRTSK